MFRPHASVLRKAQPQVPQIGCGSTEGHIMVWPIVIVKFRRMIDRRKAIVKFAIDWAGGQAEDFGPLLLVERNCEHDR